MTTELQGKVALVTGGTSGIGRESAVLFAKAGAKVVLSGRREKEGNETIGLIRAAGGDGLFVKSDVSKAAKSLRWSRKPWKSLAAWMSPSITPGLRETGYLSSNNRKKTGTAPLTSI